MAEHARIPRTDWHPALKPVVFEHQPEPWELEVDVPEGPDWDPANDALFEEDQPDSLPSMGTSVPLRCSTP